MLVYYKVDFQRTLKKKGALFRIYTSAHYTFPLIHKKKT